MKSDVPNSCASHPYSRHRWNTLKVHLPHRASRASFTRSLFLSKCINQIPAVKKMSLSKLLTNMGGRMKLGIVICSNDPETVWNAFRLGVFSCKQGDTVSVFLLGKGVEAESLDSSKFDVMGQIRTFSEAGGSILACGTCLKIRQSEGSDICPMSTMLDLHALIRDSDKVLNF